MPLRNYACSVAVKNHNEDEINTWIKHKQRQCESSNQNTKEIR